MGPEQEREGEIVAHAPCRADLAGSTLDIWPLYLFHRGAVTLNFAVSVVASCRIIGLKTTRIHLRSLDTEREESFASLRELWEAKEYRHALAASLIRFFFPPGGEAQRPGFYLETNSESPAGAGIAGSSALMIATTAALARLAGRSLSNEEIRILAQNVEAQIIRVPTGCQDYYPALYGGMSAVHLDASGIHREGIALDAEEIDSRFLLAYTGAPRQSGINNWEVFKAHLNGDKRVFRNFEQISQIAQGMHRAISGSKPDWEKVGRLLREEWKLRKSNVPTISTPLIDTLIAAAAKNGGMGAKVCGAGGGGCVVFLVEKGAKQRVSDAISRNRGHVLSCRMAAEGLVMKTVRPAAAGA